MEVLEENFLILGAPYKAMESSRKIGNWMRVKETKLCFLV